MWKEKLYGQTLSKPPAMTQILVLCAVGLICQKRNDANKTRLFKSI